MSVAELYALQEIDLALDGQRAALADVQSRLGEPEQLVEARHAVEQHRDAQRAAARGFKEREAEADELRQKIGPLERRLYEGSVRNPKELEDLQLDVESLKRRRNELEDRALEAMDALEQAQQALEDAQRRLDEMTQVWEAEQADLRQRQAHLEQELAVLDARRAEQAGRIDAPLLRLYQHLQGMRQGRAVARVEGGACQGCRISLPMNLLQRARSGPEVVQCNNCERILYVS